MHYRSWIIAAALLVLCACSTTPLVDKPVQLRANQGLVAVVTDTLDTITDVDIEPQFSGGKKLSIPLVPPGHNIYLFVAPAGSYCFVTFDFGSYQISREDGAAGCFEVRAGQVNTSVTVGPRVVEGKINMGLSSIDPAYCTALLRQHYPKLAGQYSACAGTPPGNISTH